MEESNITKTEVAPSTTVENEDSNPLETLRKENEELKQRLSKLESDYRSLYDGLTTAKSESTPDEFDSYCSEFFKSKRR